METFCSYPIVVKSNVAQVVGSHDTPARTYPLVLLLLLE